MAARKFTKRFEIFLGVAGVLHNRDRDRLFGKSVRGDKVSSGNPRSNETRLGDGGRDAVRFSSLSENTGTKAGAVVGKNR